MESRLPKPKIMIKKAISTTDITTKNNNHKITKGNNNISTLTTASSTNQKPTTMNENKPPAKQTLTRAKTLASITRPNNVKAVKRTATNIIHGEVKKSLVKPVAKALINKPSNNVLTTNSTVNKVNKDVLNNVDNKEGKFKKWDLRGRLAHTSDKLTMAQQKNKDMESKYNTLQEMINALKTSETECRIKAEKLEDSNNTLTNQLETLTVEMSAIKKNQEDLIKRLKESEESCTNVSRILNECQKKCKMQEELILEQSEQLTILKTDLKLQKEINEDLSTVKEELQVLTHRMDKERRLLHNTIQELKGNIRVFCRVRPRTPKEIEQVKAPCNINFIDDCTIEVGKLDGSDSMSCSGKLRGTKQEFSFDKVFAPNASQEDVFEELSLLVQSALEGYNVCIFAYGQTGSGKTYTMEGEYGLQTEGMIPRTVRHIFKEMKQFELLGWKYRIEASFLEIYNEHIVDLLDSQLKTHEIRMVDNKGQDLYVSNLLIEEIHSPEELHECLRTAQRNRAVAATQSNERSSRSHSVTRIRLIGTHIVKQEVSIGNLNLVDLAGSERLKSEEAIRTAETKNINKSLANLGNVILALLKKQEHIPYRNSKLTHLLMPSLGGNSKTLMLLNISPLDECYNETLNSLRFASNVNNCKTGNIKRSRMILHNTTN
ncbi:protein claret segregational [Pogonomyrmex barbatus]|uniref:protein claret segregational n=1 Tax=Pogonomyrmex barbatus TaxID=144034 RepID=A0A6I9W684_9HYME|nr:protein claret segregational [Pogonomyrmex barbatus]XP_011635719.1 protein claret segregational [Pogonomyrmex barbatus]XP_011635720.1 protein claret segregational [Pogonomyrmex barbatus]XP_011635721.1 protein claret segregational [Pogonomyrmex barbatus]